MSKFYITTPIYYVNDVPHIGHTYTTVAADVLSRWNRLLGKKVFFLTGTDEHGAKIYEKATEVGKKPEEFCNMMVEKFKLAWKKMNISYDYFIRTTDKNHIECVKKFLLEMFKRGSSSDEGLSEIYKAKYDGLYCIQCEKFLKDQEITPDGLCADHKVKLRMHSEENYFFRLSKYREKLIEIISNEHHPEHFEILPVERKNEILGKLKLEVPDVSISRAALKWAIPLPFDPSQTTYVWIDALINYISAIGYNSLPSFTYWWPADLHLIGKDILWFHCVIWPAMLLSVGLPLPKRIFAHGYFTVNGEKMSKTLKNVILPEELIDKYGVDSSRFLLLSAFPFGSDGDISLKDLTIKYNAYLANNIGNLIQRVINMVDKYFNSEIPHPTTIDFSIISSVKKLAIQYMESMNNIAVDLCIKSILEIANFANQYVDREAPWRLSKSKRTRGKLETVLYNLLVLIKYLAVLCNPFMPETSLKIWKILDEKESFEESAQKLPNFSYLTGKKVKLKEALFPKL